MIEGAQPPKNTPSRGKSEGDREEKGWRCFFLPTPLTSRKQSHFQNKMFVLFEKLLTL